MSGHISSDHSRSASRSSQNPRQSQGQYESMPRHSLGRTSRASNPNVFSDEYSLEPIYVDQIERAPSPASIASSTTLNHPAPKPFSATAAENDDPFADDARSSIDEPPRRSSLPQKGGFANNRNSVTSLNNATFAGQRTQSVSSRFSIPRALSPYTGATGPSHPYSMYPQVGIGRSPSVGSTSTIRPFDRPLGETSGPQHPYGMYTQNVVEEGMDDEIPVGFPGLNSQYQSPPSRRMDDVGDIIGPDGHTEPLPPYSRYPTGAAPKPPGVQMPTMAEADSPVDINLPPQEDQQLSSTSREQTISNTSSRALIPQSSASSEPNAGPVVIGATGATAATGIMAFEEKLKRKGKQTVCCGLPVWTIVLIVTILLIGGSIGGVIGGVLGTRKAQEADRKAQQAQEQQGPHIVTVTASAQLDYSSITSTPTNYKPAPTGHYLIPAILQNYSRMCVEDHDIKEVWSCLEEPKDFEVYVGSSNGQQSIVFANDVPTSTFSYGAQQPILPTPTQNLSMVMDTSDTGLGAALFFWSYIDKLVILPESALDSTSASKRDLSEDIVSSYMERKEVVQSGEKPWFCWWNQTILEFFLYVNQTATDTSYDATAATGGNLAASMATAQANAKRDDITNYPRIIKMEERRDHAGASSPYCQQMQLESNGHIESIPNKVYSVQEIEPTPTTTYINTAHGSSQTYTAKAQWATPCYCLSLSD